MSRYHGNDEACPHCGVTYGDFRTGMTYSEVFIMLWSSDDDSSTWVYKRRSAVLGKWHQIKKEWWKYHTEKECERMGLPSEEYKGAPGFEVGEFEPGLISELGMDEYVPF